MTGAFATLTSVVVVNPLGIRALGSPLKALTAIGAFATFASALVAGAVIVIRYRNASPEVRQQIRWLRFVGIAFIVESVIFFSLSIAVGNEGRAADIIGNIGFTLIIVTL